jgi:hypothetical protein
VQEHFKNALSPIVVTSEGKTYAGRFCGKFGVNQNAGFSCQFHAAVFKLENLNALIRLRAGWIFAESGCNVSNLIEVSTINHYRNLP